MSPDPIRIGPPPGAGAAAPADEALKERAAGALERAHAFVTARGGPLAALRARVVLQAEPSASLAGALFARQRADGGFDPLPLAVAGRPGRALRACGVPPGLAGTLEALAVLGDARLLEWPGVEAAVRCVEALQRPDGSFPAAAAPDEAPALAATGLSAGLLARTRYARPERLVAAGEWLAPRFSPERVEQGDWATRAAFSLFFTNVQHERSDEALQWCGRELERGFRTRSAEALEVLQVLLLCEVGAMPGASFAPEELLERLLDEQASDGGFDALCPDGAAARCGPTIDAMRAIIGLCATF